MKIEQSRWTQADGWIPAPLTSAAAKAQLVLVFGARHLLEEADWRRAIRESCPLACLIGCTTAGEICGTAVSDDSLVVTAVTFANAQVRGACLAFRGADDSAVAGEELLASLPASVPATAVGEVDPLAHVLVFSDGLKVNGSDLVSGLIRRLPTGVTVTGGLAGDGAVFGQTRVLWNDRCESHLLAAVGLYGRRLQIGFGSLGGWDPFGPERLITRSAGNVLYELDGQSALGLYRRYLGEHAARLPSSGLLFPLSLRSPEGGMPVVRTILSVNEAEQSMTFAGNLPQGSYARLMKANFDRLIEGATTAAGTSRSALGASSAELALLISCVGRRLILKQRVEEEVEGVRGVLGEKAVLTGFYSYGEISPFASGVKCELHNQTMTITTFREQLD